MTFIMNSALDAMLMDHFHTEVSAMLDSGTSFIVIPKDDFAVVSAAMFGQRLRDSCGMYRNSLLCACDIIDQTKPLQIDVGGLHFRIDPGETFMSDPDSGFFQGGRKACQTGLGVGNEEATAWILGDVFLRQAVVVHDPRGNVSIFPRVEVEADGPASSAKDSPGKPPIIFVFGISACCLLFAGLLRCIWLCLWDCVQKLLQRPRPTPSHSRPLLED